MTQVPIEKALIFQYYAGVAIVPKGAFHIDSDIVVTGYLNRSTGAFFVRELSSEGPGVFDSPMLLPVGEGGGEETFVERSVALVISCSTAAGLAKRVQQELVSYSADGNTVPAVEYAGSIIKAGDRFELYLDQLFTDDSDTFSLARRPQNASDGSRIVGLIHNHPSYGEQSKDLIGRYPSRKDWASADLAVAQGASAAAYSLFLTDSPIIVRESKYSDKQLYGPSQEAGSVRGDNLPGQITTSDCMAKQ